MRDLNWQKDLVEGDVWSGRGVAANGETVSVQVSREPDKWHRPGADWRWEITWPNDDRTVGFAGNPLSAAAEIEDELDTTTRLHPR